MKKDLSKVFGKMSYGMYVLTTDNGGCIVDAACQISSSDSPLIAVSVNKQNYTNELLHKNNRQRRFCDTACCLSVFAEQIDIVLFYVAQ